MADLEVLNDISEIVHYNNPRVPLYIVRGDLERFPNKRAACHWHEDIEIMYILRGHITYHVNGELIDLDRGEAIIVNARQLHYGFSRDNTNCDYYCYVFKPALLVNSTYLYETYIAPVVSAKHIPYTVISKDDPLCAAIRSLLPAVYQTLEDDPSKFELQALSILQQVWKHWYDLLQPQLQHAGAMTDLNIRIQKSMIVYIQKNYQQKLTISDIAAAGHISRTKCCQLFKKYYNVSPIEYVNNYRIELSTRYLKAFDLSMTEIALSCGFNSSSYYSEMFLKVKGLTPSEYRKRAKRE